MLQGRARPRQAYVRAINGAWGGRRAWVGLRAARILAGGCGAPSIFGHIRVARKGQQAQKRRAQRQLHVGCVSLGSVAVRAPGLDDGAPKKSRLQTW